MNFKTGANVFLNLCAQGAAANGQLDTNGDDPIGESDVAGHAEIDDVVAKFGVDDCPQQVADFFFCGGGNLALAHEGEVYGAGGR